LDVSRITLRGEVKTFVEGVSAAHIPEPACARLASGNRARRREPGRAVGHDATATADEMRTEPCRANRHPR
jgi:hypothetical protein